MDYLFVNTFARGTSRGAPSGIDAYVRAAAAALGTFASVRVIAPPEEMDRRAFQEFVLSVVSRYDPATTLIEAPEARAATFLLPPSYAVHVRLHCPAAIAQFCDGVPVDHELLHEELQVIHRARVVSSPSRLLAAELEAALPGLSVAVFRHPPPYAARRAAAQPRDIDFLFLGRNQRLKGSDLLEPILNELPYGSRVVLAGDGMDLLRLPGGLRRRVELRGAVRGAARDELYARAKVVLLPSLFESFSMVLAEAIAHGCRVVAWSTTAAAELAPPPLLRIAPEGDVSRFGELASSSSAADEISADAVEMILDEWRADFLRGQRWVLRHAHRAVLERLEDPVDHRRAHGVDAVEPTPVLPRILKGEGEAMTPRGRDSSWQRKLRKLRTQPKAFFRDSKLAGALRSWWDLEALGPSHGEPRLFGTIDAQPDGSVRVHRPDRKIAERDLATIFFTPRSDTPFISRPVLGELLGDKNFIGFRDRYLFVAEHDLQGRFRSPSDIRALFDASPEWTQRFTRGVRNAVFVDPEDVLPFLVRATDHEVRLIVFLTRPGPGRALLEAMARDVDVLVTTPELANAGAIAARRHLIVDGPEQIPDALRRLVIDHKQKEHNVLLPVFGNAGYLEDIDTLHERDIDGVIILREEVPSDGRSLSDYIDRMVPRTQTVLLREVRFHQYRDICERGDLDALLRVSLEDGCRYDVRT